MSKRKGRKPARSSEIKSVLRAPPEGENELEMEGGEAADAESDTLPLDVLAEVIEPEAAVETEAAVEPEAAVETEPDESAAEHEPPPPLESTPAPRARRLRAVRAEESDAFDGTSDGDADALGPNGEADESAASADGDGDGDGGSDADTAEASDDDDASDETGDDEPFRPFSLEAEGDDTEGFLRGLIEALLFTSQKPLDLKDLARSAGIDKPRAKELLEQLMLSYEGRGVCVEHVAGGYVMRSAPRYAPYIQKILSLRPVRLSRAQLETLAIVAYRQPVTKPEVDDIRGVDSGQVIKGLLERALLKMLGKKDEPGRPTLYGTTSDFLELLNLQSLKDLPTLREYTELSEESQRKFLEETGETPPSGAISFERPVTPATESGGPDAEGAQPGAEAALESSEDGAPAEATLESSEDDAPAEATLESSEDDAPAEAAGDRDDASSPEDSDAPSETLEADEDEGADEGETAAESEKDGAARAASEDDDSDEDEDEDDDSDEDEDDDSDEK